MELNADFAQRVLVHARKLAWQASPMPGVDRRMLERIGDEVARATSIVRYAPQSQFSAHTHTGGEEYIVLEGVFQDEHGDFPVGSYVRNPPTSSHTPGSEPGCTIFVKLWQFDRDDRHQIVVDMNAGAFVPSEDQPGVSILPLFADERENVRCELWEAGTDVALDLPAGGEFLVLEGSFKEGADTEGADTEGADELNAQSWLRLPSGGRLQARAGTEGARVWVKTGHLPFAQAPSV